MHQESNSASAGAGTPALSQRFWCPACHDGPLHSFLVSFSRGLWSRRLLNLAGTLLSIPWRWLDPLTLRTPAGGDAAGSVYFFGRRAAQPISVRELIGLYRGGG